MHRVRLIHWKPEEALERIELVRAAGYEVDCEPLSAAVLRRLRAEPPDAVIIDLGRLPSQGRDLALGLRKHLATRHVPMVFAGGAPEKIARVQQVLPDAIYASWREIDGALEYAIAHPLEDPVVPGSLMDGYAGTLLPGKFGIKAGSTVALVNAPEGFEGTLGELPDGAQVLREASSPCDVTLWFVRSREELAEEIGCMAALAASGGLWIIWPKKASGVVSNLSQAVVRQVGLRSGLVDFKICSVDATWSGLRFTQRRGE